VDLVHLAQNLDGAIPTERPGRVETLKAIDVQLVHIHVGQTVDDPVGDESPHASGRQDAQ
jgi:hypothetical protein